MEKDFEKDMVKGHVCCKCENEYKRFIEAERIISMEYQEIL